MTLEEVRKEIDRVDTQFPTDNREKRLQAVANTFCENMNVEILTVVVSGETLADGLTYVDAGK